MLYDNFKKLGIFSIRNLRTIDSTKHLYEHHCNAREHIIADIHLLSPLLPALCTLVECRHRLVRTTNLQQVEKRLIVITPLVRTLDVCLVHIIPRTLPTHDVFDLFPFHRLPFVVSFVQHVLVGTTAAFEAVLTSKVVVGGII